MIIELIFILFTCLTYYLVYVPWKRYRWYIKTLSKLNYKFYDWQYSFPGGKVMKTYQSDLIKYSDGYYTAKTIYPQYELTISNVFNKILIEIISPNLLRQFFSNDKVYIYKKSPLFTNVLLNKLGPGVLFAEGLEWKKRRKALTKLFNFDYVRSLIPLIIDTINQGLDKIQLDNNYPKVYLIQHFATIFGKITSKSFFGLSMPNQNVDGSSFQYFIAELFKDLIGIVRITPEAQIFGPWVVHLGYRQNFRKINRNSKIYRQKAKEYIEKRINEIEKGIENESKIQSKFTDFVALILQWNKTCQNVSQHYTVQEIIDQFSSIFSAGTQTSSHFVLVALYYLNIYPEIRLKALAQIQQHIHCEDDYNYDNLKKLKYIQCLQNQVLRFYGPVNSIFMREAAQDHHLGDIPILKGTLIWTAHIANNYNEKYYQNPKEFKPERWLQPSNVETHPFLEIGFSSGLRSCLGKQLALIETKICLIKFLKKFNYELETKELKLSKSSIYSPQKLYTKIEKKI